MVQALGCEVGEEVCYLKLPLLSHLVLAPQLPGTKSLHP